MAALKVLSYTSLEIHLAQLGKLYAEDIKADSSSVVEIRSCLGQGREKAFLHHDPT